MDPTQNANALAVCIAKVTSKDSTVPLVGIAGPQGSGKTTLLKLLVEKLKSSNIHAIIVSLDDFYFPKEERERLAQAVHPLLRTRGVPGTHDIKLLADTLRYLTSGVYKSVTWPKFDKATDDVCKTARNVVAHSDLDVRNVILLEGWCVGCNPLINIDSPINQLECDSDPDGRWRKYIDKCIRDQYMRLWRKIDFYVYVSIPCFGNIVPWRLQQAIGNGEKWTTEDIQRFVAFFERITRQMMRPEGRMKADIVIHVDTEHRIASMEINVPYYFLHHWNTYHTIS